MTPILGRDVYVVSQPDPAIPQIVEIGKVTGVPDPLDEKVVNITAFPDNARTTRRYEKVSHESVAGRAAYPYWIDVGA